jgi:oxygen-dependent protoporphyrinogen oxidase
LTPDAELEAAAVVDASRILGVPLSGAAVDGFARVTWNAPLTGFVPASDPVLAGIVRVGGAVAGRGLAGVVKDARAKAAELLADPAAPSGA